MTIKYQVGAEQWTTLINAPTAAATYVSTASGGGLEMIREILSASKFSAQLSSQEAGSGYGPLVDEVLAAMKGMSLDDARSNRIEYQSKDPAGIREELRSYVTNAVALANTLDGAEGYKRWIIDMAREVAETKTGGFLGIGAKSVIDEKEQAALDELRSLLAV